MMVSLAIAFLALGLGIAAYAYFGYPLLLKLLKSAHKQTDATAGTARRSRC